MLLYLAFVRITLIQFVFVRARYGITHQSAERIIPKRESPLPVQPCLRRCQESPLYLKGLTLKCGHAGFSFVSTQNYRII